MSPPAVTAVLLAAGRSTRFGAEVPKQLAEVEGEPLVRRLARRLLASAADEVLVVVGHAAEAVRQAVADLPLRLVENPRFAAGQSTSVRSAVAALRPAAAAALFVPVDQPFLTVELVDRLVAAYAASGGPIVAPVYRGRRGAPVLLDRSLFGELRRLRGDTGGREVVRRHPASVVAVPVDDPLPLADADHVDELRALLARHLG